MLSESDRLECSNAVAPMNGVLELVLRLILGGLAIAIVVAAVLLMLKMDESWRSHGGRYLVAVGAFVLLIGVDTQLARLAWRRFIAGLTLAKDYQRRSSVATLMLVFAAVFLFSQALLLP